MIPLGAFALSSENGPSSIIVKVVGLCAAFGLTVMLMKRPSFSDTEDGNHQGSPKRIHKSLPVPNSDDDDCEEPSSPPPAIHIRKTKSRGVSEGDCSRGLPSYSQYNDASQTSGKKANGGPPRSCLRPSASMPNISAALASFSTETAPQEGSSDQASGGGMKRSESKLRFSDNGPSMIRIGKTRLSILALPSLYAFIISFCFLLFHFIIAQKDSRHDLSKEEISSLYYAKVS